MKNQPNKIYLNLGLEDNGETCKDFNELSDISWCTDKIYSDDLEYISSNLISAKIKETEEKIKFITASDSVFRGSMSANKELNRLRGIKKALKELLK